MTFNYNNFSIGKILYFIFLFCIVLGSIFYFGHRYNVLGTTDDVSQPSSVSTPVESPDTLLDNEATTVANDFNDDINDVVDVATIGDATPKLYANNLRFPRDYSIVDDTYFDNAVFLGDSRMKGFIKYCGLTHLRAYAYVGLDVEKYFTYQVFSIGDEKLTASQALELDRDFDKVYIMFGTNELGWPYGDTFISKYQQVITHIKECNPDAVIYITSILPVAEFVKNNKDYLNNDKINLFNSLLTKLALDNEVYYLDIASVIIDENGALPSDAAPDGIHLSKPIVMKCLDYMRTHAILPLKPETDEESDAELNNELDNESNNEFNN